MKKGIYLNDSIHGLITLTEYEKRIISTIGFNRLHDVYQNSTVYLTFPTNRTKRFEHSIGTMKLCSDMFFQSLLNTSDEMINDFFAIFEKEYAKILDKLGRQKEFCEEKFGGRIPDAMPQIEFGKLRHSLIPNNIPQRYKVMYLILMESVRAAALLHDIGHPPFSHIVEYALKEVYQKHRDAEAYKTENEKEFMAIMSKYFEDDRKLHEQMGDEISEGILSKIIVPIQAEDPQYDENLFEALIMESVMSIFSEEEAFSYLHRILDASLDGDRLDYVTRDAFDSGMDSGRIDYSRIINEMQLMVEEGRIYFCVPLKAIHSVEDFIKRRYNSYKEIIYHHRVIKTDFLLEGIVMALVEKYLNEETQGVQRNSEVVIPFDISGLWFPLGDKKSAVKANALSQWNDSWLMTVLRQIYYTGYYHNPSIVEGTSEYVLSQRLTELLRNSKRYYSLVKRNETFKMIDDAVKMELIKKKEELEAQAAQVSRCFTEESNKKTIDTDRKEALYFISQVFIHADKKATGFLLSFLAKNVKVIGIESFERLVEEIVKEEAVHTFTDTKVYDTVTLFKSISVGLDRPIYFYNHKEKRCTLEDISGIAEILQMDSDYLPVFYIYILVRKGDVLTQDKREELLGNIGTRIGKELVKKIKEKLSPNVD